MRILVADLVAELSPKYDNLKQFAAKFEYNGDREIDLRLSVSDNYLDDLMSRAAEGVDIGKMENFAFANVFNRSAIRFNTMLVHSSALIYGGKAYLFSGDSGIGKSFHTRLWLKAFGSQVHIMNDDKPVVRLYDDRAVAFGTPFDGGSGIALNEAYPLGAVVFIERGEENSVRVPDSREIIQKLYFQTAHMLSEQLAEKMLDNFSKLLSLTKFYVLTCNTDISAAHTAFNAIIEK